ncbi:hypothetical protein FIBSPDRAFT_967249 [Athelia psychrophila]|uniref:Uncharacterized protein n=1 Tax=Athelia psychrophila TaxID=1759441 RepID=A0A167VWN7_9AGAM|nr:hypothetical protein FIBSPDRAFT_967249 [Fibularhizoctonia sp. CBS 109695]
MSRSKFPAAITPNDLLMTAPPPSDREPVPHRTRRAAGCAAFFVLALLCAALFTWARWAPRSHEQRHPLADKGGAYSQLDRAQKEARTLGIYGYICESEVFERKTTMCKFSS